MARQGVCSRVAAAVGLGERESEFRQLLAKPELEVVPFVELLKMDRSGLREGL